MPDMKTQLTGGNFEDFEGNALVSGYLTMVLDQDTQVNGNTQLCAGFTVTIPLDTTGNVVDTTSEKYYVWANNVMSPINNYYTVSAYAANGQLVWGPNVQQVTTDTAFDVGTWVPDQLTYWVPPPTGVTLQTNGILNGSQSILNLQNGTSITFADLGNGTVTASTSAGVVQPYDIIFSLPGLLSLQSTMVIEVFTRQVSLPVNLAGAAGFAGAAPSVDSTWTFYKNGTPFGTTVIDTSGVFTFTAVAPTSFTSGDRLSVQTGVADVTLTDVAFTLSGTR